MWHTKRHIDHPDKHAEICYTCVFSTDSYQDEYLKPVRLELVPHSSSNASFDVANLVSITKLLDKEEIALYNRPPPIVM